MLKIIFEDLERMDSKKKIIFIKKYLDDFSNVLRTKIPNHNKNHSDVLKEIMQISKNLNCIESTIKKSKDDIEKREMVKIDKKYEIIDSNTNKFMTGILKTLLKDVEPCIGDKNFCKISRKIVQILYKIFDIQSCVDSIRDSRKDYSKNLMLTEDEKNENKNGFDYIIGELSDLPKNIGLYLEHKDLNHSDFMEYLNEINKKCDSYLNSKNTIKNVSINESTEFLLKKRDKNEFA